MCADRVRRADIGDVKGTKKTKITDFFLVKKIIKTDVGENVVKSADKVDSKMGIDEVEDKVIEDEKLPIKQLISLEAQVEIGGDKLANEFKPDYSDFAAKYNFNKEEWIKSLPEDVKELLELEIDHLHITWLTFLHKELTKPYFINLKRFLKAQLSKTVFPPKDRIYSWSHYTPLPDIKCLILGQDPYHNHNQAHGLAFSVLEPTKPPPSLKNIYKGIINDYPEFQIPDSSKGGGGNLTKWAKRGVFLLNTCLTVEAHKPNSHSKHGWETFTQQVINCAINYHLKENGQGFVVMAWGMPAQNTLSKFSNLNKDEKFLVIKTFHPSPFSAAKGFFTLRSFKSCNEWLETHGKDKIDWSLVDNNNIF